MSDLMNISGETSWTPGRRLLSAQKMSDLQNRLDKLTKTPLHKVDTTSGAPVKVSAGTPKQLLSVSATQSPFRQNDRVFSQVSVVFTRDPSDTNFAGVHIWFTGYKGNPNPVLVYDGNDSPVTFIEEVTGETVTVTVQPFGPTGHSTPFAGSKTTNVTLNGQVSAPPSPSIAQQTVTVTVGASTAGQQFQFNFLPTTLTDKIDGYWIYKVGSHTAPTPPASRFKFVKHPPTSSGVYTFQDLSGVSTNFYWVSAVSQASGLESSLADATPAGGGGGGHTTTTYYPNTSATHPSANSPFSSPANAYDGNQSTAASGIDSNTVENQGLGPVGSVWSGWPNPGGSPITINLKILSKVVQGTVGGTATIQYSTNSGSTWTTVFSTTGNRSQTTDVISLSTSQNISTVQVRALAQTTGGVQTRSCQILLYEMWIEVTV